MNPVKEFHETLGPETDRGVALVCAEFLNYELESLLRAKFIENGKFDEDLFATNRPQSTFSGKISLAHAIGLISSEAYRELNIIRRIRNNFAHSYTARSFEDGDIRDQAYALKAHTIKTDPTPRQHFIRSVMGILGAIHATLRETERSTEPAPPNIPPDAHERLRQAYAGLSKPEIEALSWEIANQNFDSIKDKRSTRKKS